MRPKPREIVYRFEIGGWRLALVSACIGAALAATLSWHSAREPYRNADYVLVADPEACVYARREVDHSGRIVRVFRSYDAWRFDGGACPRHQGSAFARAEPSAARGIRGSLP
ncbi:MAG: hypothetical protein ACREH4_08210 [Vitreimonas sp.]